MLNSYFFIPANNKKFIDKAGELDAHAIVFDLEDAIGPSEIEDSMENLRGITLRENHYVRLSFFANENYELNEKIFSKLLAMGFRGFVIPKFRSEKQVHVLNSFLKHSGLAKHEVRFILLVEHPAGLFELIPVLKEGLINFMGVALGSHDYADALGMKHTLQNLYFGRQFVLNLAKAFDIDAIDIVSLETTDYSLFNNECLDGFQMGFDGKFLIHPGQLKSMNSLRYYSHDEVEEALAVQAHLDDIRTGRSPVIRINGKAYERPHVNRLEKIIKWSKYNAGK
jgi:citrate lyase beta subunit